MKNNLNGRAFYKEIAKQVPALLVLAFVVWIFCERHTEQMAHIDVVSNHCHEVQRQSIETNLALVKALGELRAVVERLANQSR
jgi:hypothetical protein